MLKRHYILLFLVLLFALPVNAVLKEDSLSNTLAILRTELEAYHDEYGKKQNAMKSSGSMVFKQLMQINQNSNQNAIMLYSQKDGYVFDLTYACHEAIEQYRDFRKRLIPFRNYVDKTDSEVARFDSLIVCLKTMPVRLLDDKAKVDRNVCLALAVNTRRMVVETRDQLNEYITIYKMTESHLRNLNDYAQKKYSDIQNSIFVNGGDSYLTILSRFSYFLSLTKDSFGEKYSLNKDNRSQWSSKWIVGLFMVIVFYGFIAILLNLLIVRLLMTRLVKKGPLSGMEQWFMEKRTMLILATTAVTFAIILGVVQALTDQNFIVMASSLLVQFAWLMSVIIISLLLRTESEKSMKTLTLYLPLLVTGFLVISFRVVLIPNAIVNLIFPPILLICSIWQWVMLRRIKNVVAKSDRVFAIFSQIVFLVSLCSSLLGYTLLAVQLLIWWIMQLTCILTIICLRDWYKGYSIKHKLKERPITETWHHSIIYWVGLPTAGVASVVLSLYWAADVFNLSDLTWSLFTRDFIDSDNFKASISGIATVTIMYFVFNYINHTAKAFAKYWLEMHDASNAAQRYMMVKNVMQIFIWGVWFLASLSIFSVSNTWLVVISGGLSTGIGFASKDILENIYYGISLMTGRIKIGDLIVCDGVRGTVSSISYTSTTIDTIDGSVIAFQNSQLFTKNYKNMTRNHGYECHILDVGVAYGTNVKQAREIIANAVQQLSCVDPNKKVAVVLKEFADSALTLKVVVWVNVFTQFVDDGIILEAIYDALNENNIEIPFPQLDIHHRD